MTDGERLERIERRIETIAKVQTRHGALLKEHGALVKDHRSLLKEIRDFVARVADDHEQRITALEQRSPQ